MKIIFVLSILLMAAPGYCRTGTPADSVVTFKVSGVCDLCKKRIEDALELKGVRHAEWNIVSKMLTVSYDPSKISLRRMVNKIAEAGHDSYYRQAPELAYNALPSCCHYREMQVAANPGNVNGAPDPGARLIRGVVLAEDGKGVFTPLVSATVLWLGRPGGTVSDSGGTFQLPYRDGELIVSYSGYRSDTVPAFPGDRLRIVLASGGRLAEVKVVASRPTTYTSSLDMYRTQNISQYELFKAACCNLSQSFETNPSVDVAFNDAVTGSRQIQLLGLAGVYTQLTVENLPGPRGLATPLGMDFIPGSWIESIQLSKGTGSVVNGYESIAGQINVELKKPGDSEKVFVNGYADAMGKQEYNLNFSARVGKKWGTTWLLHDGFLLNPHVDFNHDGFRDLPTGNQVSGMTRWTFDNQKGWTAQTGLQILNDGKTGGQVGFDPKRDRSTGSLYGIGIHTARQGVFAKAGYIFPAKKYQSIGLQLSAFNHDEDAYFGVTTYDGHQQNFYSNLIYQSIIRNTAHRFRTGLSLTDDHYNEYFNGKNYRRNEVVPGGFFEYTFSPSTRFGLVAGIREDHNNLYGWFFTPRLNVRYQPFTHTTVRLSVGRGERTADIFAENNGIFASSRRLEIVTSDPRDPYGLKPEIAWDKGISIDQKFRAFTRPATFSVDFFRNDFIQQVVVDVEDPRTIRIYNLDGRSRSNSFQSEISLEPASRLEVRVAYRHFDVKTTYGKAFLSKPLLSPDRGFMTLDYTAGAWKFDCTTRFNGRMRLPPTGSNPPAYQRGDYSPDNMKLDGQVSRSFGPRHALTVYVGAENITNYFQKDPVVAADQPFSPYFDATMVWGPLTGRMFYGGIRYMVK